MVLNKIIIKNRLSFLKLVCYNLFGKQYRLSSEFILRLIVDRELGKYGVDFDYVKNTPSIDGIEWFAYYTFDSEKEYQNWRRFVKKVLKLKFPFYTDNYINNSLSMIDLNYGLKYSYK